MAFRIDSTGGGIGDVVVSLYIAQGLRNAGHEVFVNANKSHRPDFQEFVKLFGFVDNPNIGYTHAHGGFTPEYKFELSLQWEKVYEKEKWGRATLWQLARNRIDPKVPVVEPARPEIVIAGNEKYIEAGEKLAYWIREDAKGLKIVGVSPSSNHNSREWGKKKFERLYNLLEKNGFKTLTMGFKKEDVSAYGRFVFGHNLATTAVLISNLDLQVGNDSGLQHIAGLVNTKSVAVMGPTRPEIVFGHEKNITAIEASQSEVPCMKCHFKYDNGYSRLCDSQCDALDSISAFKVFSKIKELLND